jgi:hypothetical protein
MYKKKNKKMVERRTKRVGEVIGGGEGALIGRSQFIPMETNPPPLLEWAGIVSIFYIPLNISQLFPFTFFSFDLGML